MSDRLKNKGLLAELREQLDALEDRATNCKASLLDATFVLKTHFDLDTGRIRGAAKDLADAIEEGQAIRARIDKLEEELGL